MSTIRQDLEALDVLALKWHGDDRLHTSLGVVGRSIDRLHTKIIRRFEELEAENERLRTGVLAETPGHNDVWSSEGFDECMEWAKCPPPKRSS